MSAREGYLVLVDGYNVIKRQPAWNRLRLEAARTQLVALLARARWPVPVQQVVAVFDAAARADVGPVHPAPEPSGAIEMRFTSPSADAYIQQAIRTSSSPHRVLIISDDQEIVRTARSHKVISHSTRWLLQRLGPAARSAQGAPRREEASEKPLPAAARRITEELAKRWLKPER